MRGSCNGCRVLRKGCRENCELRECLEWIRNSQAQANATVFLAKFYGRSGLVNLINSGPPHLRSTIFRSLLYEACGRAVDPVFGSLGLLCSGNWHLCHAAVQSVLNCCPIPASPSENSEYLHKVKHTVRFKARRNPSQAKKTCNQENKAEALVSNDEPENDKDLELGLSLSSPVASSGEKT
eukprot:TRINITY_DN3106_c0_g1_i1.p1 TRINITY_DN3106_c0_g1~~TRINITY_DN3106_c0_g1_i1.p1  ORF type:complete len:181 (+),score=30.84 TRINITY_DN3106_c0_g1_i1:228-770(+)